ncbi:head-tail connector protein [Alteriqipengyuania lutimaris]|uniref:Phage gp6-like head-tail connector protein n=1 Tax=Alteriqipengyuania lutimaris TaxID=1538146 RepID=A0A395LJ72_9SPHN|nr:head-tail connector protein [Alteriqipengyuania lutimaris]MBB3034050.1 putative phiE125 gp8 family phage protein [Alteriqipengyuania lutimaris]RDS77008.1 hypothetical protein DL238_04880 [Alteriqipengyuania lutimaris]
MLFELGHVPMPSGYGDAILSLDACKAHLRVSHDAEDDLIRALRDAAIEYVELYCGVKLGPVTGLTWRAQALPSFASASIDLAVRPVTAVTAMEWLGDEGSEVSADPGAFRFSEAGELRPIVGGQWPSDVGCDVVVTFDAGYAEGEAPPALLSAVRLMLGHLYMNREAVVTTGAGGVVPFGVSHLCTPFRPVMI